MIRNLGEDVKEGLRNRAKAHGRSLEAEVRDILRVAALAPASREGTAREGLGTRIARIMRESGASMPPLEDMRSSMRPALDFSGRQYGTYDDEA